MPDARTLLTDTAKREGEPQGRKLRATKVRGGTGTEVSVEEQV